MAMQAHEIEDLIRAAFLDATITIEDLRGDGDHYSCMVESAAFAGKTRVQQHQMVYNSLGGVWAASCMLSPCRPGFRNPDHRSVSG